MAVGGDLIIDGAADILYDSSEPLVLGGNFVNHSTQPAIFDWLERDGDVRIVKAEWGDEVTVTVRIKVPSVVPGIDDFGYAEKSATMPKD